MHFYHLDSSILIFFQSKKNQPRLKGNAIFLDDNITKVNKGVFTTCKKRDGCPPWVLSASEIEHDKKKQIINYKNTWLKVYDIPVLYFPKFNILFKPICLV